VRAFIVPCFSLLVCPSLIPENSSRTAFPGMRQYRQLTVGARRSGLPRKERRNSRPTDGAERWVKRGPQRTQQESEHAADCLFEVLSQFAGAVREANERGIHRYPVSRFTSGVMLVNRSEKV
jgi:hypothetical protein